MRVDVDGNIYFEPGETIPVLSMYQPATDEPGKFVPKYTFRCEARIFMGKIKACSKRFSFLWWCTKFQRTTSIKDCEVCDAPDKPGFESAPLSLKLPSGFVGVLPQLRQREDSNILVPES